MVNPKIKELLRIPSNSICADCLSNAPTHISCHFGVFICSSCSHFHQNILYGKNIVKPIESSIFTEKEIEVLKSLGNKKSNEKYERNVPSCYKKPTYEDPLVLMEQWIRAKYERNEFDEFSGRHSYLENVFEGFLWKRGKEKNVFKVRRFVLNKNLKLLMYFTKEGQDVQAKAKLNVEQLEVFIQPEKVGKDFGMQIMVDSSELTRSLYVYAETGEDMVNWYTAIYSCKLQWLQIAFPCTPVANFQKALWSSVVKEGWLLKCGPRKNDAFYRRWVVLVKRKLLYYIEPMDPFPKGEVFIGSKELGSYSVKAIQAPEASGEDGHDDRLSACSSGTSNSAGSATTTAPRKGFGFCVETPRRLFTFQTDSEALQADWIDAVQSLIDQPLSSADQKTLNRTGVKRVVSKRISNFISNAFNK